MRQWPAILTVILAIVALMFGQALAIPEKAIAKALTVQEKAPRTIYDRMADSPSFQDPLPEREELELDEYQKQMFMPQIEAMASEQIGGGPVIGTWLNILFLDRFPSMTLAIIPAGGFCLAVFDKRIPHITILQCFQTMMFLI